MVRLSVYCNYTLLNVLRKSLPDSAGAMDEPNINTINPTHKTNATQDMIKLASMQFLSDLFVSWLHISTIYITKYVIEPTNGIKDNKLNKLYLIQSFIVIVADKPF